jgi:hypothetical protein
MDPILLLMKNNVPIGVFTAIVLYAFRHYFLRMEAMRAAKDAAASKEKEIIASGKETVERSQDELEREYRNRVDAIQIEFRKKVEALQNERLAESRKVSENAMAQHEKTLRALMENTLAIQAIRKSFDNLVDVIQYTRQKP